MLWLLTLVATQTRYRWRADLNVEDGATADQTDAEIDRLREQRHTNAFTDADETKLEGIGWLTADQTGAEIKALYEAEADTNAFTDADEARLDGIISANSVVNLVSASAHTGGSVGALSSETSGGGAIGFNASTTSGGAIGDSATSDNGFAGGAAQPHPALVGWQWA